MNRADEPPLVIMMGGGVESTSLAAHSLAQGREVVPIHVHCGLIWDDCESLFVRRFCDAKQPDGMQPLIEIHVSLADWLADHWAATGRQIPRAGENGAKLEIPVRNLTLLSLAIPHIAALQATELAVGTTKENSFRDGSRAYFDRLGELISIEVGRSLSVLTPLIGQTKTDVIRATDRDTLAHSFSCVDPQQDRHCGRCIKCGSRQRAFAEAEIEDPTDYVHG